MIALRNRSLLLPLILLSGVALAGAIAASGSPAQPSADYESHDPIEINGDSDLDSQDPVSELLTPRIDNGVRHGSGTADDPYVIERWTIERGGEPAIKVVGTTKHLVIREIEIVSQNDWLHSLSAIWIDVAQNVTVQSMTLGTGDITDALLVFGSMNVQVIDVDVVENGVVQIAQSQGLAFDDVRFQGPGAYMSWQSSSGVIQNSHFEQTTSDGLSNYANFGMAMTALSVGNASSTPDVPSSIRLENVTIESYEAQDGGAMIIRSGSHVVIRSSSLRENEVGLRIERATLQIDNSTIWGNRVAVMGTTFLGSGPPECTCRVRHSTFGDHKVIVDNPGTRSIDVRYNWWGSDNGPDPALLKGPVDYTPWLNKAGEPVSERSPAGPAVALLLVTVVAAAIRARKHNQQ